MDTLVVGLDGGEWDVINPMIEAGELPNLATLKTEGVDGPLESITPPVSPPAWNSIQTGTNPGKHGIFDFSTFDENYHRRSVNSSDRQATPFWEVMNDEGVSTGLFKLPFTYPPDDVSGFMVTGFPTPDTVDDYAKPASLTEKVGPVSDLFEDWSLQQSGDYQGFKQNLIDVAERQTDLFIDLVREYNTDVAMTVYDGSDRIQHFFWKYFDENHPRYEPDSPLVGAIEEYYRAVDRGLGRILDEANQPCDVLVLSDHGFGPLSYDIYIDEWLEQEGFLSRRDSDDAQTQAENAMATILRTGWEALQKAGIQESVKSILPTSLHEFGRELQEDTHRITIWDETQVFFTTLSGQGLYVNLEGEFREGIVSQERYDAVVEEVRESLLSLRHPDTGVQLVEDVVRSDEVFEGWALDDGPDLIVRTEPVFTMKGGRSESLVQASAQNNHDRSGDHRTEGIFIANGPSFTEGRCDNARVIDIAPTLLYLLDCPIPKSMDGKVITEIIRPNIRKKQQVEFTQKYGQSSTGGRQWSVSEEQELEDRLSDMGYLG